MRAAPAEAIGARTFAALGTFASLLVADRDSLELAYGLLAGELLAVDMACSRFRTDSELWRVNHAHGHPVGISPLLTEALATALTAARITDGDVDPTCGQSLARLGYDRDFAQARQDTTDLITPPAPAAEATIRVFAAWPPEWDATFTLRARGAFVVTAAQKEGKAEFVEILSEAGAPCRLKNPWGEAEVMLTHDGGASERMRGPLLEIPTKKGERLRLAP